MDIPADWIKVSYLTNIAVDNLKIGDHLICHNLYITDTGDFYTWYIDDYGMVVSNFSNINESMLNSIKCRGLDCTIHSIIPLQCGLELNRRVEGRRLYRIRADTEAVPPAFAGLPLHNLTNKLIDQLHDQFIEYWKHLYDYNYEKLESEWTNTLELHHTILVMKSEKEWCIVVKNDDWIWIVQTCNWLPQFNAPTRMAVKKDLIKNYPNAITTDWLPDDYSDEYVGLLFGEKNGE